MRYFVPDIRLPQELAPQAGIEDKFGGMPWGLPAKLWPVCKHCKRPQVHLFQLAHHPERLHLGRPGRVLYAFQCANEEGECPTWEGDSGANACFVVEPEDIAAGQSAAPRRSPEPVPEVRVVDWQERDDALTDKQVARCFADDEFAIPDAVRNALTAQTRLGSAPNWLQSIELPPGSGWRFVGQFSGDYGFLQPPQDIPDDVFPADEEEGEYTHMGSGPNFGDGLAYVFVREQSGRMQAWLLSQS